MPAGEAVPDKLPGSQAAIWSVDVGFGLASPVVSGGKVFYLDRQEDNEVIHAADAETGKMLWSAPVDDITKDSQSDAGPRCTPLVEGDRVYAQSSKGKLRCLAVADGKVLWQTDYVKDLGAIFIGEKGKAEGATRHGYTGSPLIDGPHLIALAGGKGAAVVCFDKMTGSIVWKSQDETPGYAAPIIADVAVRGRSSPLWPTASSGWISRTATSCGGRR